MVSRRAGVVVVRRRVGVATRVATLSHVAISFLKRLAFLVERSIS